MKIERKSSAIQPTGFGLRIVFSTLLMGILCLPVFGQLGETKTENKPMVNSLRKGTGEVISMRPIKIKSEISSDEFEKWVIENFNPAWEGLLPGVRGFIVAGDTRGKAIGEYAFVVIYDSLKSRNAYLPKEGIQSEWFKQYSDPIKNLNAELGEFLEDPDSFGENYYSWIVLR